MTPYEIVDLLFCHGVQILKFMQGGELDDVESIRSDDIGLAFQQVFGFDPSNFGNGGKNVR